MFGLEMADRLTPLPVHLKVISLSSITAANDTSTTGDKLVIHTGVCKRR